VCDVTSGCTSSPRGSVLGDNYTNIWLLNASAQVILSGVSGLDSTVAANALSQGTSELMSWNALTQTEGVIEYDSPTYYGIDPRTAVLMSAAACATDADLSQLMARAGAAALTTTTATTTTWTASLSLGGSSFAAERDRANGQILGQSVGGVPMSFPSALGLTTIAAAGATPTPMPALPASWGVALFVSALGISGLLQLRRRA
jgi:hypothetical protein